MLKDFLERLGIEWNGRTDSATLYSLLIKIMDIYNEKESK